MKIHQKVWSESRGEDIPKHWHIHHLDGNRNNNNADNLVCVSPEMHFEIHAALFRRYGRIRDFAAMNYLAKDKRLMEDYQCPSNPKAIDAMTKAKQLVWKVTKPDGEVIETNGVKELARILGCGRNIISRRVGTGKIEYNNHPKCNKLTGNRWVGYTFEKYNKIKQR